MKSKPKWNGLCPSGRHGLDYEGQACDCSRRKPKAPKVEAWAVEWLHLPDQRDLLLRHTKHSAQQMAALHESKIYHLVPADPHAKLKADVMKAAVKVRESVGRYPDYLIAIEALIDAVSKLQKVKP